MKSRFLLLFSLIFFSIASVNAQCLEVTNIFVNSCGNPEGENEMFTFQVGAASLNTNNISVNWPSNSFLGWCQNAGTVASTAALNATISNGCGYLLEPVGGVIPANANVIAITSTNFNTTFNSFSNLADTMYIIYQCVGNSAGHFANAPSGTRTLEVLVTGPCTQIESVTYDDAIPNTDGATAVFDAAGNVSYAVLGCNAPVIALSTDWSFTNQICNNYGVVDLTSLLSPNATIPGTWSGPRVSGTSYDPTGYLGLDSITYTIAGSTACAGSQDSTIVFSVVQSQTGSLTTQSCDSVFYGGAWYTSSSAFIDTTFGAGFACDSFTNVTITIQSAIIDSSYLSGCNSIVFNGTTYSSDIILRDTIIGTPGGTSNCSQLFISEYLEGSGNNKALEIFNGTGVPVNLANYTIERYTNGSPTASLPVLALSGTLADGDVYVIYNPSSAAGIIAAGDLSSGYINHNGNDAYALLENGIIIDVFGNIGCDPGTEWNDLGNGTQDNSYYRLPNYTAGAIDPPNIPCTIPSLNATNWFSTDAIDNFSNLGVHLANCGSGAAASCDSVFITNIDILDPVTSNNPGNPFIICDTNDSIQLPGGAYANAAGTYNYTFTGGASNGCDSTVTTVVQTQSCNYTCTLQSVYYDSYEYVGNVPGVTPGSIFQPQTVEAVGIFAGRARTGSRFFYMNIQNGYVGQLYTQTIDVCAGSDFQYSFWIRQYDNSVGSNFNVNIYDGAGTSGTLLSTQNVVNSGTVYNQIFSPILVAQSNQITFELVTISPGGAGNDICFDDLEVQVCQLDTSDLGTLSLCNSTNSVDFFNYFTSAVSTNGTWTGPSALANGHLGTFNPSTNTFGDYFYTAAGSTGCGDTIFKISPSSLSGTIGTDAIAGCDSVLFNGTYYFASTSILDTITGGAANGCDSVTQINIQVLNSVTVNNPANPLIICASNDSVQLPDGSFATTAGTYPITYLSNANCDSTYVTIVQTQNCGCFFDDISKTLWVRADTLMQNGTTTVTAGTANSWGNIVANPLIPNLSTPVGGGTRTILPNEPTFNFNSTMNFVNAGLVRNNLPNNAMLDPNQGSMFVVATQSSLSFAYVVGSPNTGVCGGNRCSTGYRGDRTEFGSANNFYAGSSTNPNVANVLAMTANTNGPSHKNSINGVVSTSTLASAIPASTATVYYEVAIGNWPGFNMTGKVAEAIAFNRELTTNEYEIVESYLGLKYGATLSHSYYASDYNGTSGTISFSTGLGYDNNIAGIGRDDCFELEQIISHSVAPGAIVTMALTDNGGSFAAPNTFDNNLEFLTWGNNGGSTDFSCSSNTPAGYNLIYNREWLTQQNGAVGNTAVAFDMTAANLTGVAADYALVIDTDGDGLYSDETAITGSIVSGQLVFTNVNLDNETFTLVLNSAINTTVNDQICNNGDYTLPDGSIVTTAGTYVDTLVTASACDSIVTTILTTIICDCQFDLGPDTSFCQGDNLVLDAGPGFDTYTWQDNSTNQTFTASATGTYYCTTTFVDSTNNLVTNGDFQQGNSGFTTDYVIGTGGAFGQLTNAGTYAINTSPSNVHNNFFTCADHTGNGGNMMIVNGSNTPNTNVWCQTISVVPNTDYIFSAWAMSLENTNVSNVATLHFLINGAQFGPNFSPSFTACDWQQFSTTWNSGANTSIQICIESDVISGNNDYALDDIFFTPFCNSTDSIDITVNPIPTPNIGPDIAICQGTDTLLDATTLGASYLWQDGTTNTATFTAQNAGLYFVDVTVNGCTASDSLNVTVNPVFNQTANTSICAGDSAFIASAWQTTAGVYTDNFNTTSGCDSIIVTTLNVINSQTTNDVIEVCANELPVDVFGVPTTTPGNYADTISSTLGCDSIISNIELIVNPLPSVSLGSDTNIDAGNVVVLTINNANINDTYTWINSLGESFSGESITTSPSETATYILTAVNQFNCESTDSLMIIVNPLEEVLIQLPTAFSPNGDGINDVFRIANFEDFDSYILRVYNRWGELIFDNQGYNVSWDGSFQGVKQNIGAYAFFIEANPISGAATMKVSGNVTLIR